MRTAPRTPLRPQWMRHICNGLVLLCPGLLSMPARAFTDATTDALKHSQVLRQAAVGPIGQVCTPACTDARGSDSGAELIPFWQRPALAGVVSGAGGQTWIIAPGQRGTRGLPVESAGVPPLQLETGDVGSGASSNRQALVPALMSAVVPGAGQLRNGSLLRGLGYVALELGGWMAYLSFSSDSKGKESELADFSNDYWSYDRYHRVAPYPDSCAAYGCPTGTWDQESDSLIVLMQSSGGSKFYDYIARNAYACGWDSRLSRDLYCDLWVDREDRLDDKRLVGQLIFLNHLISAVDAFMEARRFKVKVGGHTELGLRIRGLPNKVRPQLVFTSRFN